MNVEFDGESKLIRVIKVPVAGVITIDIQTDIYSAWKDWVLLSDNSKFLPALRTVGGDPTTGEKSIAPYYFLTNGWKIAPYEADHMLVLQGNLFVDSPETYGASLIVPTVGDFTILANIITTSDATQIAIGSGVTEQDKEDIAEQVWLHTTGAEISERVDLVRKIQENNYKVTGNQLVIYEDDGETPLVTFNLKNKAGQPTETDVYERSKV